MRLALEVGPGTNVGSVFNPRVPISYRPVFVDVEPPDTRLRHLMWVVAHAEYLPFRENTFHALFASHVIEHLGNPFSFLCESFRVLRRGGILRIWTPNFLSVHAKGDPEHKVVFNFVKLSRMIARAGFVVQLPVAAGSCLPRVLRKILHIFLNLWVDELQMGGRKP